MGFVHGLGFCANRALANSTLETVLMYCWSLDSGAIKEGNDPEYDDSGASVIVIPDDSGFSSGSQLSTRH